MARSSKGRSLTELPDPSPPRTQITTPSALSLVVLRQKPEERCHHQVGDHQHEAFEPIRSPIGNHAERDQHGHHHDRRVQRPQIQIHGLVDGPAHDHGKGHHEECDLRRGADGDADGDVHFVVDCHAHGPRVLAGVSDDGQQDDADECLTQTPAVDQPVDRVHQELRGGCHQACGDEKQRHRDGWRELSLLLLLVVARAAPEHVRVRVELEDQESDVRSQDIHAAPAGDLQQPGGATTREGAQLGHLGLHVLPADFVLRKEDRGERKGGARQQQHRHVGQGGLGRESLFLADPGALRRREPPHEEGHAQHEQQVREDASQQRALHDADLPCPQGLHGQNHLDGVAEGGIQQAAQRVVLQPGGELLRGVPEDLCERDHR
mmetsp:Transcript_49224/g.127726  ORF Transcript_49224/g.127726 Transcript_49224/m.127726 type:complete len:378 (-) Transcript_49224:330-1463(-)